MKYWVTITAAALAVATAAAPAPCQAKVATATSTSTTIPADIPEGPADENTATSTALVQILEKCAEAYRTAPAMHAAGTYIQATKDDTATTYIEARMTLDYKRPDKLAVVTTSNNIAFQNGFYANGTTTTHVSHEDQEFVKLPQPELEAFAETYRAGDIYREYSGALGMAGTASLLVSHDPLNWIHEGVVRYVYEGNDVVGDHDCYRVRFNQEDPESIVIIWIDKKNFLIRKISYIDSYDEDYNMVDSFEEGAEASMTIVTWNEISIDPAKVPSKAFDAKLAKNFKEVPKSRPDKTSASEMPGTGSFWGNLVKSAAKTSTQETTWSLTRREGEVSIRLEEFVNTPEPIQDGDNALEPDGKATALALATKAGDVHFYTYDAKLSSTLHLPVKIDLFSFIAPTSGPLVVVTDDKQENLLAYDMTGNLAWRYSHPYSTIDAIRSAVPPETALYLDLGTNGLRKLGPDGSVQFANKKIAHAGMVTVAPPGIDRISTINSSYNIEVLDKNIKSLDTIDSDDWITNTSWDKDSTTAPLVCLAITGDSDVLLQRRTTSGDIVWTTMIEPKSESGAASTSFWAKIRRNGAIQEVITIFLSDGQIVMVDKAGKVIYRGIVQANDALVEQNEGSVMRYALVADINNDGADEIYFPLHTHMMRLETE